ncbi:uncharacterized protein LOC131885351 isoform X3 [Tigriopus californicus]|uniref:uncharacterized protein LOC131885351 isoform X3 n=1 Tax=Tigriopus californicus TaxID=6832 RepID=UPI0027DA59CE|nr:uncharacterized protein LOC131885351 isoform X3 [Tigriopus californicus]
MCAWHPETKPAMFKATICPELSKINGVFSVLHSRYTIDRDKMSKAHSLDSGVSCEASDYNTKPTLSGLVSDPKAFASSCQGQQVGHGTSVQPEQQYRAQPSVRGAPDTLPTSLSSSSSAGVVVPLQGLAQGGGGCPSKTPLINSTTSTTPTPLPMVLHEEDEEEEEEEVMTSVRLPVKQSSSSGGAASDPSISLAPAPPPRPRSKRTTCGIRRSSRIVTHEDDEEDLGLPSNAPPVVIRPALVVPHAPSGDADDEYEEEDCVFAHVVIGGGSLRRQSNSFELGESGQQRQRHLRFLRAVHSATARLNSSTQSTDKEDNIARSGDKNKLSPNCLPSTKAQGELAKGQDDDDEEEGDENSIGGLGKRIRKLSSRTIEFCDSIDELTASGTNSLRIPGASGSGTESQAEGAIHNSCSGIAPTTSAASLKMGNELKKAGNNALPTLQVNPPQGNGPTHHRHGPTSLAQRPKSPLAGPPLNEPFPAEYKPTKNVPTSLAIVEAEVVTCALQSPMRGKDMMRVPQFSMSVESDASHVSHESASTVITNTTMTHSASGHNFNAGTSNRGSITSTNSNAALLPASVKGGAGGHYPVDRNHLPSQPQASQPSSSSSSGLSGALSSLASSLMSMRHRSSSETNRKRQQQRGDGSSSRSNSTERPLKINEIPPGHQSWSSTPTQIPPSVSNRRGMRNTGHMATTRNAFRRQDTPHSGMEIEQYASQSSTSRQRRGAMHSHQRARLQGFISDGSSSSQSQSLGSCDFMTPPSIVCTDHDPSNSSSRNTSNSSNATPVGFGSSLDDAPDQPECDTPVMDEFAQFLNASIHPPNELSVPRCYPDPSLPSSPTLLHPMSMPGSRRSSSSRGTALSISQYRNARSLSLGYQQQQQQHHHQQQQHQLSHPQSPYRKESLSPSPVRSNRVLISQGGSLQSQSSLLCSPGGTRPVLRRESAQDFGDDDDVPARLRLNLPKQPPDLKIELLTESSAGTTPSSASPYHNNQSRSASLFPYQDSPGAGPDYSGGAPYRRHSHCQRPPPISRNKSAPATPLSRSITNVTANRMPRSPSRDGYLMVPERQRGSSLPEGREQKQPESDLYRLRQFTISNKRIVKRSDSLQPRRSVGSVHSSASSSLSHSHSGRSSLRSSTEDDDPCSSRNSSLCSPRFTVLMCGASEVGKTLLTNQFMSSSDVGNYSNLTDDYDEKCVSVLLEGEEAELVFIDHPSAEISVENALATYIPDAMVVVFSVVDNETLGEAEEILQYLWRTNCMNDKAVIMVGNKTDLVRSRQVNIVDAKAIATSYDCKYSETSASLNHNVDELLVGILTQIRLKLNERSRFHRRKGSRRGLGGGGGSTVSGINRRKSAGVRVRGIIGKMLGGDSKSKSCDDLHVL